MRLPQTTFIADGLYLFVGKSEHIFCLRDSPVHQVAADTDTKLLPEHASQIVFTDKKMLCQKIQAYFLLIMLIQVLLYRKYILFFQICIPVFFSRVEYSCAVTPQVRQTGNRLSGLAETAMRVYSRNVLSKP